MDEKPTKEMSRRPADDPKEGKSPPYPGAFLGSLLDLLPELISYIDRSHRYRYANKAYTKFFHIDPASMIGRHPREVIGKEAFEKIAERIAAALDGKEQEYESSFLLPDGNEFHFRAHYLPRIGESGVEGFLAVLQDITTRKSAEGCLQESEDRFRALFEKMPSGVAVYEAADNGGDFILKDFNRAAERIEKVDRKQVIGKRVTEAFPGVKEFGVFAVFRRVWETGKTEFFPESLYRDGSDSGSWRECWVYKLPSGDLVAVYNDVTERKRSEEALRESQKKHKRVSEHSPAIVYQFMMTQNGDFTFPYISDAVQDMLGVSPQEAMQDSAALLDLIHPDDREAFVGKVVQSAQTLKPFHETIRAVIDGRTIWIECRSIPERMDDGGTLWDGFFVDVTERVQAEESLKEAILRQNQAVKAGNVGLWDWDLKTNKVHYSAEWKRQIGYEDHEISDDLEEWQSRVHPDDLAPTVEKVQQSIAEVRKNHRVEFRFRHRDGSYRWILAQAAILQDENGRPSRMVGSHIDLTGRKQMEAEKARLEQQIVQGQKLDSIGKLAGGIAHDYNNMLNVILGYSEDLLERLHPEDPMRESVNEIVEASKRSASLTRQLLAFSRKQPLRPEVLDLNRVVKDQERMLQRIIGEDIELKVLLAEKLDRVEVDPSQIMQVILNMASNARDAMPRGGILTIETENVVLDEDYARNHAGVAPGAYVMLSVTDTGCGMDEETREKVFEPFFSTKESGKGTGLGLSTVYGIVKQSRGYIWVYSEPDRGTTFKIYLPATEAEPGSVKFRSGAVDIEGKGEQVLVVEDEPSLQKLCAAMLKKLNYRVTTAANGGEALLLVEEKGLRPDLIITDIVMPEMSGKTLTDRLKKHLPDLKVLYMSGYTDNAIVHHGILDSDAPFIQKPFSRNKLGKAVRQILE